VQPPQDPEDRIAELERELAEAKNAAAQQYYVGADAAPPDSDLAVPPRRVPSSFVLAEVLPFRWWYIWALFMVAIAPIALWFGVPLVFAVVAVAALVAIYVLQFRAATTRLNLLKWGVVANVIDAGIASQATYYSGTTYYNVYLPVANGWTVTRERWSGPSTRTSVQYKVNGHRGEVIVKGREYRDGVILADSRNPSKALCVSSFRYDLDRDASGNWVGRLRMRLTVGMVVWLFVVIGWLMLAGVAASSALGSG
jgi:hypothetical protein